MNLAKINLNLLIALQALLEERNVTRAAQHLHVTQSALSKSLAQLRQLFDDPLLVRVENQLHLTPLAEELKERLDRLLGELEGLLLSSQFDPAQCHHSFTIAMTDCEILAPLPGMLARIHRQAPGIHLRLMHFDQHSLDHLNAGKLDLCLGYVEQAPGNLYSRAVSHLEMSCVMSARHPLADQSLTLEGYLAYPHVINSVERERGKRITAILSALGHRRQVCLELPLSQIALRLLPDSDLLMTIATPMAGRACAEFGLVSKPLPFELPALSYQMLWHERTHRQTSHRWLRQQLLEALAEPQSLVS